MKRFNTITSIVETGLITSTVITGVISIAAFASGVGLPVGTSLSGTNLCKQLCQFVFKLRPIITLKRLWALKHVTLFIDYF